LYLIWHSLIYGREYVRITSVHRYNITSTESNESTLHQMNFITKRPPPQYLPQPNSQTSLHLTNPILKLAYQHTSIPSYATTTSPLLPPPHLSRTLLSHFPHFPQHTSGNQKTHGRFYKHSGRRFHSFILLLSPARTYENELQTLFSVFNTFLTAAGMLLWMGTALYQANTNEGYEFAR